MHRARLRVRASGSVSNVNSGVGLDLVSREGLKKTRLNWCLDTGRQRFREENVNIGLTNVDCLT